jgi:hypothetical protein
MIISRALTVSLLFVSPRYCRSIRSLPFLNRADIIKMAQTEDIQIAEREYGYRTEPLVWPELIDIIGKEQNLAKLSRSVQQQKEYIIYRRELLKEWKSVYDHILVTKFDFDRRLMPNDGDTTDRNEKLWEAYPPLSEVREVKKVLRPNDFPYYFADCIEHWCLWKLCEDVTDEEIEEAKKNLQEMHGDVIGYLSWRNPPHLKSLPDIDHIHILCLREAK